MANQKYTEAKKQANKRWDEANRDRYARLSLVLPSQIKPRIQSAAEAAGQSVNAWILDAIRAKL